MEYFERARVPFGGLQIFLWDNDSCVDAAIWKRVDQYSFVERPVLCRIADKLRYAAGEKIVVKQRSTNTSIQWSECEVNHLRPFSESVPPFFVYCHSILVN